MMEKISKFKEIFWDAFHRPKLETQTFFDIWNSLEKENELLAGPLYSIYSNGHCNYVFEDRERFPSVSDADDFLDYCTTLVKAYHERVAGLEAVTEEEKKDKQLLLYQTDIKMELANLAYEILRKQ